MAVANARLFGKVTDNSISDTTAQLVLSAVTDKKSRIQLRAVIDLAKTNPKKVSGTATNIPTAQTNGSARPSYFLKYWALLEPKITPKNPAAQTMPPKIRVAL